MGLPFFVNCSFLIQRVIYFETAPSISTELHEVDVRM